MVHRSRGTDAVYRCPKGGLHKFRKHGRMWVLFGFTLGWEASVRYRKCTKCGLRIGPTGVIKQ